VQPFQDLVGLLLVLADDDLGVGMAEHKGDLVGRAGRVDSDGDAPHDPGTELRDHPLDTIVGENADMAAISEPEGLEAEAKMADALVVLTPGQRSPDAEILLQQRDRLRLSARLLPQHLGQRQLGQRGGRV
jgi:hypothetical protein